jgi:hypothetical protein
VAAGLFAVLSLLYRAEVSADQATAAAEPSAEPAPASADPAPSSAPAPAAGVQALTKRAQAERAFAELSANGAPPTSAQLAAAAGLSSSYARALVAEFHIQPAVTGHGNGQVSPRQRRGDQLRAAALTALPRPGGLGR